MSHSRKLARLVVPAFAICIAAFSAQAQDSSRARPVEARFEVLHMFINSIQVRKVDNMREIHTFVYSDQIRGEMQERFNNGAYQYGDKVKIVYQPGAEIALRIKGRHSKPPKPS